MRYQIALRPRGQYTVVDTRTGQVRYVGPLAGARQAAATLNARR
jgi:hypothetical protein